MEYWCMSKIKHSWLLLLMIIGSVMVCGIGGGCIEEERNALLQIKTFLTRSFVFDVSPPLPSWVSDGGMCCDWERVKCNTTTGHVTHLYLGYIIPKTDYGDCLGITWSLNVSVFLHFKELISLNLSKNCLDDGIINTGLGRLSSLKKLQTLDLSDNTMISSEVFPSLGALTSLRHLDLSNNYLEGYVPPIALENLEILDLGINYMQGFERVSLLKKLKVLNLGVNMFNASCITSLSVLPMLKSLDLSYNDLYGSPFPLEELVHLTNLEELDLSENHFNDTPSIQECKRLSGLKKLKNIALRASLFNKSMISCLSALPSLRILDLSNNLLGGSFPIEELSYLSHDVEVFLLNGNHFNGTLPIKALASHFHYLEVLDLSYNNFSGSIPSTIQELSSLKVVSFAGNELNGSLPDHGLCDLKNLIELDLSHNMFYGSLPQCFNRLSSLKLLDISSNQFAGILMPSLITNLTSLEYIDFSNNKFGGSFLLSSLSNLTKLEVVIFVHEDDKFEVETEEPRGWIPMFQLKLLLLSGCNINRRKGSVFPNFLLHQRMLHVIDLSDNSLVGPFPNWLIANNTMLSVLILRKNSFSGSIHMPPHVNSNMRWLDVSGNHINGIIPDGIHKFLPYIIYLNLSRNSLDDVIPSSIGHLSWLSILDLSDNELSGEVPKGLFSNNSVLSILRLSKNRLHGQVLSGNLSLGNIQSLHLDNNRFTGKIGNESNNLGIEVLDISYNSFEGTIPHWLSNNYYLSELMVSNNNLEGPFPCGTSSFSFLDLSQNSFSGPIPSCLNFLHLEHLHLASNRFNGSIPKVFRNLTRALTLDIGNNSFSGQLPEFLGNLSDLRILILRKNNFSGSIPMQLCQLGNVSLLDLSSNSLSGLIPSCLQNITSPVSLAFRQDYRELSDTSSYYKYLSVLHNWYSTFSYNMMVMGTQDEVQFTTKTLSLAYKGSILDYMVGLDLSSNKLTGEIPEELGLLIEIRSLNLSHNLLNGPIPVTFLNLEMIESLDLSSNNLTGEIPSQLIQLHYVSAFNVSHNNLSGRVPDMKGQFSTFTEESYEGNPLLCGLPLAKKCMSTSQEIDPSAKDSDKWYDIDMASFYGSSGSTWVVFMLGFVAVLYINPYWRKRWLDLVEECMYTSYYFIYDSVRKLFRLFHK